MKSSYSSLSNKLRAEISGKAESTSLTSSPKRKSQMSARSTKTFELNSSILGYSMQAEPQQNYPEKRIDAQMVFAAAMTSDFSKVQELSLQK